MAENAQDRLQPFLLDRLLDDEPDAKTDSATSRAMTGRKFRQSVLRDLAWLLNAHAHPRNDGIGDFELVAKSVLNYGIPEVTGVTESHTTCPELERMVRSAILAFEPRINPATLSVSAKPKGDGSSPGNNVVLEIKGDIRVHPLSEPIYVKTNVDLDTGHCEMQS